MPAKPGNSQGFKQSSLNVRDLAKLVRLYNEKSYAEIEQLPAEDVANIRQAIVTILENLSTEEKQQLPESTIVGIRKAINPYGPTIREMEGKWLTFAVTDLDKQFKERLLMTSMVSFMFSKLNMWKLPKDMPIIDAIDFFNNPNIIRELMADRVQDDQELQKTIEDYEKVMRQKLVIVDFLESIFQFNPNVHVEPAYKPNLHDPTRDPIMTPAAAMATAFHGSKKEGFRQDLMKFHDFFETLPMLIKSNSRVVQPAVKSRVPGVDLLKSHKYNLPDEGESLKIAVSALMKKAFKRKWTKFDDQALSVAYNMIHPANVYADFEMYTANNYETLVKVTENLFAFKKDTDLAINPYSVHDSHDKAVEFVKKHRNTVITDIQIGKMGSWNFLCPSKDRDKNAIFMNEESSALAEIMDQVNTSAVLGQSMMKKSIAAGRADRARQGKAPDEETKKWITAHGHKMGVDVTDEDPDFENCPDDKIEVLIHNIEGGGLKTSRAKIFMDAEPVEDRVLTGSMDMTLGQPRVRPADEDIKPVRSSIIYPPGTLPTRKGTTLSADGE